MRFDATIRINRSANDVYGFVSDPRNDTRWRTGVTEAGLTSAGPLHLGTTGFAAAGPEAGNRSDWQVTELIENERVTWKFLSGPFSGTGGYRFVPQGDATTFTLVADIHLRGWRRLMSPLIALVGPRRNRKDLEKLKALLESRAAEEA